MGKSKLSWKKKKAWEPSFQGSAYCEFFLGGRPKKVGREVFRLKGYETLAQLRLYQTLIVGEELSVELLNTLTERERKTHFTNQQKLRLGGCSAVRKGRLLWIVLTLNEVFQVPPLTDSEDEEK